MSAAGGPNLVEDGLVFYYDTGNVLKSYKGEPTTNIVTNPTFIGTSNTQTGGPSKNWYFSGDTSATGFQFYDTATAPIPLKFPDEGAVITTGPNGTSNRRIYYNGTVEPNTTYTLSYWIYSSTYGAISTYFFTYKADGTGTTSPSYGQGFTPGEWTLIQKTFTTPADTGSTRNVNWGPVISSGTNSLFAMQRFQIEAKPHATSFVNGTRSSTEGLLDLTGNSTIDLSNVSFDSNAQMTFDGTDDTIALGDSSIFNITGEMTVSAWIKPDSIAGWKGIFGGSISGFVHFQLYNGGINVYVYGPAAAYGNPDGVSIGTNVWTNVTFTFGSNTLKVYLNGEQLPTTVTGNGSNISSNADVRVGWAYATSRLFQGSIKNIQVYNRALLASEVAANFNGIRSRFNI